MKKFNFTIIINLFMISFLCATFYLQYNHLFVTRVFLIVFAIVYLVIEIGKKHFLLKKITYMILGGISVITIFMSVLYDANPRNSLTNERIYFIPVYLLILFCIQYKELYGQEEKG